MQVGKLPSSEEELVKSVLNDSEARFNSADLNIAYKMSVDEYYKKCDYAEALEENWGKAPGQLNTNGQDLLVFGVQFGNVFIGVQPTFGYEGDPMRLLFSKSASPHHGFAAYYTFLEKVFEADAVLHFGTHGSLEFMPGKQVRSTILSCLQYCACYNQQFIAACTVLKSVDTCCVVSRVRCAFDWFWCRGACFRCCTLVWVDPLLCRAGRHVGSVLPRQPYRQHPQPVLLRGQQPI